MWNLGDHAHAEVLEHRQDVGQCERPLRVERLQPKLRPGGGQGKRNRHACHNLFHAPDIGDRGFGPVALDVAGRERVREPAQAFGRGALAVRVHEALLQPVRPGPRRLGQLPLYSGDVGR